MELSARPLRLGSPGEFGALRQALASAGFNEPTVCRRLGLDSLFRFQARRDGRATGAELRDTLAVLIRLFVDVEPVKATTASSQLSPGLLGAIERFGLAEQREIDGRPTFVPRVWMYPIRDIVLVSDLPADPVDQDAPLRQDAVYPAITPNTGHLLSAVPNTPCGALLELCAGTGAAALLAGSGAGEVWATDIAARAVRFAEFNARLNGRTVHTACGDLYDAVAGRRFDRIVAHPPYIPTGAGDFVYRDGGEDGEQVVRRVIGGLADHLEPGGSFYGLVLGTDRPRAPLEQRLRGFLGVREREFDIAVGAIRTYSVPEMLGEFAADRRRAGTQLEALRNRFLGLEVEAFVYGIVVVRHRPAGVAGDPITVRRTQGQTTTDWALDWLLDVERARSVPDYRGTLMSARLRLSRYVTMEVGHRIEEGEWVPRAFRIVASLPFTLDTTCPAWGAALLARCDGGATTRALLDGLKTDGLIPPDGREDVFLDLIDQLVGWGVVEVVEDGGAGRLSL